MFGTILLVACTLMQVYVFWRAASVPYIRRQVPRKVLIAVGAALWAMYVLGTTLVRDDFGGLATWLELWSMTWLGTLFLIFAALLAIDVITGFGLLLPRLVAAGRAAALLAGAAMSVLAIVQGLRAPVLQSYDVYSKHLPATLDATVIVAMSDLHLGSILGEEWLAARVEQVQAERPDVVLLIGDVFEGHSAPRAELLSALRAMSAPLGIWGVIGNHELHSGRDDNASMFEAAGIHLLRNAWIGIRPGLILAGMDDVSAGQGAGNAAGTLEAALASRPTGATVLMTHAPLSPELVANSGVDLMLSGHTHGGQLWPFGYLVGQRFPLFEGRYQVGATTVIVSRGTGTWGPRMRLWHPGEIIRVTLHTGVDERSTTLDSTALR